ncbi:phosphatidate cytidylyltransferase [Loktanella fryxellensis]|uniref:Phosphatidate cytidylyltransferase n=2 Tax=Loktanella fryxellensis TaxID=245187 RepID=A0A1H8IC66_9RHOB|nr:phosphatidate cytidylyltransferase [Loktanella fryxellensis]
MRCWPDVTVRMPTDPGKWDDLTIRVASSAAMVVVGAVAVMLGGIWFQMMVVFVTAVLIWELWMMIAPDLPTQGMLQAALTASVLSGMLAYATGPGLLMFLIVPIIGSWRVKHERLSFFCFALGVQVAAWGLVTFRAENGFIWILWVICVVVATDVFGYLIGRAVGGPKFWPKVSPKKTWSGTAGGWAAAALMGSVFVFQTNAGWAIVPLSIALSFASQMGDVAESALKRRMRVKDSSTLIPGHGGLFDRFDGLLGASLFMLFVAGMFDIPGVAF